MESAFEARGRRRSNVRRTVNHFEERFGDIIGDALYTTVDPIKSARTCGDRVYAYAACACSLKQIEGSSSLALFSYLDKFDKVGMS
jgi:hypothetical protein